MVPGGLGRHWVGAEGGGGALAAGAGGWGTVGVAEGGGASYRPVRGAGASLVDLGGCAGAVQVGESQSQVQEHDSIQLVLFAVGHHQPLVSLH